MLKEKVDVCLLKTRCKDSISWIPSKAAFHGYCIWVKPNEESAVHEIASSIMKHFTKRFPPLLMPVWEPHICLVAGIESESAALSCAELLAKKIKPFKIKLSIAEVDGESKDSRETIYFPSQNLRAAWIHSYVDPEHGEYQDDFLVTICAHGREILGTLTQTIKFKPHMSLVYFDESELDNEQREILKAELNQKWPHGVEFEVDSIHVARTEGTPDNYEHIKGFKFNY